MGRRAQAAGVLCLAGQGYLPQQGRHPGQDQHRQPLCPEGAPGGDGIPLDQPSAGLPDLRPGRRMRPAGSGDGLWPRRLPPLQREQARRRRQVYGPAGCDHHDPLHRLHPLRALRHRSGGRARPGRHRPRRGCRDHHLSGKSLRQRTVRQCGGPVPGGCADLQALCLQRPALGVEEDRKRGRDGRAGRQHPRRHPRAAGDAGAAAPQRGRERGVDFRQGAPCLRRADAPAAGPALCAGQRQAQARDLERGLLGHCRQGARNHARQDGRHCRRPGGGGRDQGAEGT